MTTPIAISRLHFPVTQLGPGRRVGIWLQGCSIRCPGCISVDTWAHGRGVTNVEEILDVITPWLPHADGVTISGGEPFDQPRALFVLLAKLRGLSSADILVFTGYPLETIGQELAEVDGMIDALVTDPFERAAPQTLALRGSDNQRLHFLTAFGRERFASYDRPTNDKDRGVDLMLDDQGTVWLAGIPARNDFHQLQKLLESGGHRLSISEDRREDNPRPSPRK
jgi:anaerobic ribonucleoside-triphosphate reductase activating protein